MTPPTRLRTRQNHTPAVSALVGRTRDPVALSDTHPIVIARSRHTSTVAIVTPDGSSHSSVGRCDVTVALVIGAIGRGTLASQLAPTNSNPARHSKSHVDIAHVARALATIVVHARLQPPQCAGSLAVTTHVPPHKTLGEAHIGPASIAASASGCETPVSPVATPASLATSRAPASDASLPM
ncbi:MAG: hypothetical protein U0269_18790 [Polyangiales bacterium]